jgi:hypothetical protein
MVQDTHSTSPHPQLTTLLGSFDYLLLDSEEEVDGYFIKSNISDHSSSACSLDMPCGSFDQLLSSVVELKNISVYILGSIYSDDNITVPKEMNILITTYFDDLEKTQKALLVYNPDGPYSPFFYLTVGSLSFLNLTVDFGTRSRGSFVALEGFFFFFFIFIFILFTLFIFFFLLTFFFFFLNQALVW